MATPDESLEAAARRMKSAPVGVLLATALGGLAGFGYYYFIGCSSGGCMLGAQWWSSTAYGALMGVLLHTTFAR